VYFETKGTMQVVAFRLSDEEFAIDIHKLREVLKPVAITPLPHSADFIEGVINLRGDIFPVIDLRKRFGIRAGMDEGNKRIMIVDVGENLLGIIVDQVSEVLYFTEEEIKDPPYGLYGVKSDFIAGIGKKDKRLIIILKPEKIITCEEELLLTDLIPQNSEADIA
jgi:purine-binding chemotaxis protein CheW